MAIEVIAYFNGHVWTSRALSVRSNAKVTNCCHLDFVQSGFLTAQRSFLNGAYFQHRKTRRTHHGVSNDVID